MTREENCPNCGAPYDSSLNTCPYCKTSYFDMSAIDLNDNRRPMWLKLRMGDMIFTSKVIVKPDISISLNEETCELHGCGHLVSKIVTSKTADVNVTFCSVGDRETLFTVEVPND